MRPFIIIALAALLMVFIVGFGPSITDGIAKSDSTGEITQDRTKEKIVDPAQKLSDVFLQR